MCWRILIGRELGRLGAALGAGPAWQGQSWLGLGAERTCFVCKCFGERKYNKFGPVFSYKSVLF